MSFDFIPKPGELVLVVGSYRELALTLGVVKTNLSHYEALALKKGERVVFEKALGLGKGYIEVDGVERIAASPRTASMEFNMRKGCFGIRGVVDIADAVAEFDGFSVNADWIRRLSEPYSVSIPTKRTIGRSPLANWKTYLDFSHECMAVVH